MTRTRTAAVAVFGLRVAYGAALIVAPAKITRSWLGAGVEGDSTKVALRGLGAREVLLHGFGIVAAVRGEPLLPWLVMSMGGDASDIASTFAAAGGGIPDDAPKKTAFVAGGSAALTAAVLIADRGVIRGRS